MQRPVRFPRTARDQAVRIAQRERQVFKEKFDEIKKDIDQLLEESIDNTATGASFAKEFENF